MTPRCGNTRCCNEHSFVISLSTLNYPLRRVPAIDWFARIAPACILALSTGLASAASSFGAIHHQETFKPYIARVYFDSKANDRSDAYFEILKDGHSVYLEKAAQKGEKFFIGTMYERDPDAPLVKMGSDITGDEQPDLVISEWLGGANCCLIIHIFEIGPMFKKIGTIDAGFGNSGPHFVKTS